MRQPASRQASGLWELWGSPILSYASAGLSASAGLPLCLPVPALPLMHPPLVQGHADSGGPRGVAADQPALVRACEPRAQGGLHVQSGCAWMRAGQGRGAGWAGRLLGSLRTVWTQLPPLPLLLDARPAPPGVRRCPCPPAPLQPSRSLSGSPSWQRARWRRCHPRQTTRQSGRPRCVALLASREGFSPPC